MKAQTRVTSQLQLYSAMVSGDKGLVLPRTASLTTRTTTSAPTTWRTSHCTCERASTHAPGGDAPTLHRHAPPVVARFGTLETLFHVGTLCFTRDHRRACRLPVRAWCVARYSSCCPCCLSSPGGTTVSGAALVLDGYE